MSSRLWILILMLTMLPVSCKQSAPAKKSGSGNATPTDGTPSIDSPSTDNDPVDEGEEDVEEETDPCKNKKTATDDEEESEELELRLAGKKQTASSKKSGRGFSMLATVNYEDDVKSIFVDKCVSCHTGSDKYALDTYSKAEKIKDKIVAAINSGAMPPADSPKLTSAEKKTLKAWVAAGAPKSTDEEDESEDVDDSSTASDDCDDENDDDDTASTGDWDELLKSAEVEKCKDGGKIFDRLAEVCHKAKTASYSCDRTGILAKFKTAGVDVGSNYDGFISDGYQLDQCGEFDNEPVVFFYKKSEEAEELKLMVKKLCKKGSAACG